MTKWHGKAKLPSHTHPVVKELFVCAGEQRVTLKEIQEKAGVANLHRWRRSMPRVDSLDACLNVLGLELCIQRKRDVSHTAEPYVVGIASPQTLFNSDAATSERSAA